MASPLRTTDPEVYDAIRRENRAAAQVKPEDLPGLGKIGPQGTKDQSQGSGPSPGPAQGKEPKQ